MGTTKKCTKCQRELPLTEFYKNKRSSDGLYSQCKSCTSEANRASYLRRNTCKRVTPTYTDPELDGKTNREVMDIMVRCKRWLEARGCIIHLSGEYTEVKQMKF